MKNVIADLRKKLNRRNSRMNGLEVLEAYRTLHPVTAEPLSITFSAMYAALVLIVTGSPAQNVKFSIGRYARASQR